MRIALCTLAASLLLVPLMTVQIHAADKPPVDPAKVAAELQKKLLEKYDSNKDGVLSDAEKAVAAEQLKRSELLPGSGLVPGSEEFLKRFDKNRDGKLSDAEKLAAQSAWQKMRTRGGGGPVTGGLGGGAGGNGAAGNGGLGGAAGGGLNAPAIDGEEKPAKKVSPLIKLYDKDGDGKLNDEEKAALQAERRKKGKEKLKP